MKGKHKARKECVRIWWYVCFKSVGKECLRDMKLLY